MSSASASDAAAAYPSAGAGQGSSPLPDAIADRPELLVGAAFVGGVVLARLLRLLGPS